MAVAFQSISSAGIVNASGNQSITKPSGTVEGDLLVAIYYHGNPSIFTPPSGFTTIQERTSSPQSWTGYKIAGASEPSSYTFYTNQSAEKGGFILRVDGHDATTPIATSAKDHQSGISDVTNLSLSVTPTNADSLLIYSLKIEDISAGDYGISGYSVATDNPTWTERGEISGEDRNAAVATAVRTATSATGTAGWSGGDASCAVSSYMIVVNEAQSTNYDLTAAVGSFVITGVAAILSWGRKMIASAGSFTLTGIAATLTPQRQPTITADSPADTVNVGTTLPTFCFTGTDLDGDDLRYQIQIDTSNTFDAN